ILITRISTYATIAPAPYGGNFMSHTHAPVVSRFLKRFLPVACFLHLLTVRAEPPHPILSITSNSGSSANTVISTWTEAQYTNNFTPRYAPRNKDDGFGGAVVSGDTG